MSRYFKGVDGKYYKDTDLCKAMRIVFGVETDDVGDLLRYRGIVGEVEPTVDDLLLAGQKVDAIKLYYDRENSGNTIISLTKARDYVEAREEELGLKVKKEHEWFVPHPGD